MKKTLLFKTNYFTNLKTLLLFALCVFMNNQIANSQVRLTNVDEVKLEKDICIYRLNPTPFKSFIPPSDEVKERISRDVLSTNEIIVGTCATFDVTYTGFTTAAQDAFTFAVQIWANSIESAATIAINANFVTFTNPLTLGSAGANSYWFVPAGPGGSNAAYPSALADAIVGSDLDVGQPDINANFSSTFPFYFGTDGNTPGGQPDFVSVVLHEIGHGLGMAGFGREQTDAMDNPTGLGEIRFGTVYSVWDEFIENGSNTDILNTTSYPDPSIALLSGMESDDLFSNGAETTLQNGGVNPKTYAPATFNGGSSYSHWDETTYPPGNANSLMTPQLSNGEAIHDPGNITLGFMQDMGWTVCGNILSTNKFNVKNGFTYYPNPVKDNITIKALNQNAIQHVTVFDILGKKIIESNPNAVESILNLSSLNNGIYIIKVSFENTIETFRVLKD